VGSIDIVAKWVDVGFSHPLALLSMMIAFAFCFLLGWWILSRLFVKHKKLCFLLLFLLFFVTLVSPIVTLTYLYNAFVDPEASSVGLGGSPFAPVFILLPPIGGMFLAARLFDRRNKKLRYNAISNVSEAPTQEDSKDSLS
jgi:hypothetical protein